MIKFEFSAGEVGELILACQTMVDANNKSIAVHEGYDKELDPHNINAAIAVITSIAETSNKTLDEILKKLKGKI